MSYSILSATNDPATLDQLQPVAVLRAFKFLSTCSAACLVIPLAAFLIRRCTTQDKCWHTPRIASTDNKAIFLTYGSQMEQEYVDLRHVWTCAMRQTPTM